MNQHNNRDSQLRETLIRVRAVLNRLNEIALDPDRQRVVEALDALWQRGTAEPLTAEEREILAFVSRIEASTLGTPHAQRLRRKTNRARVADAIARAQHRTLLAKPVLVGVGASGAPVDIETVKDVFAAVRDDVDTDMPTMPSVPLPVVSSDATEIFARLKSAAFHELVKSSMAGQREAIATLFSWIQPAIVRYCRSRIGRTGSAYSTADGVAEEICLAVLDALTRYGDEPASFLPFVYGIAAHKVADHYRRAGRDRSDPAADVPDGVDVSASPEQETMAADLRSRLNVLLSSLPPRQREVLVLRLVVGLSVQETAATLGITRATVRTTQHRAIAKLRNTLIHAE